VNAIARPPPKRNESLLKQITATLYCEAVNAFGAAAPLNNVVVQRRAVVGPDGGFFSSARAAKVDMLGL
jgi:hypothetical protein